jgi:hypothetical protein
LGGGCPKIVVPLHVPQFGFSVGVIDAPSTDTLHGTLKAELERARMQQV